MKAMILAAGLGTRLRPLTDTRPKALVEINGRTLLEITLSRLRSFGVNEVIINVHHFAGMVIDYLKSKDNFGLRIEISREDDLLLDTGGGLKKASWFVLENSRHSPLATRHSPTEPFLLHNVDVISNIDFRRMLQFHNENGALATLAVQSRASSRLLLFNDQLQLVARATPDEKAGTSAAQAVAFTAADKPSPAVIPSVARDLLSPRLSTASQRPEKWPSGVIPSEARNPGKTPAQSNADQTPPASPTAHTPHATRHSPLAFSGIHVISPRLLPMLTEEGVFSIIDSYLRLAAQGEKILAFRADEYYWRDLGRPSDLSQATLDLLQKALWGSAAF
jgi:NDP-sugar pyrophosphorylase family protein